jgi:hypothetical protein
MARSSPVLGYLGTIWCLLWLLVACASEPASGVGVPTSADSEGVNADRATATLTSLALPPPGSLSLVTAPGVEVPTPLPTIAQEEVEMIPTAYVPPELQRWVDLARADLGERLAIDVDKIVVVEVSEVVWPDASLGCPQPEMRYTQVLVDGLLIRLAVGDQVYAYHSGGSRDPFLCEQTPETQKSEPLDPEKILPPIDPETD